jgi:hypothetical protein
MVYRNNIRPAYSNLTDYGKDGETGMWGRLPPIDQQQAREEDQRYQQMNPFQRMISERTSVFDPKTGQYLPIVSGMGPAVGPGGFRPAIGPGGTFLNMASQTAQRGNLFGGIKGALGWAGQAAKDTGSWYKGLPGLLKVGIPAALVGAGIYGKSKLDGANSIQMPSYMAQPGDTDFVGPQIPTEQPTFLKTGNPNDTNDLNLGSGKKPDLYTDPETGQQWYYNMNGWNPLTRGQEQIRAQSEADLAYQAQKSQDALTQMYLADPYKYWAQLGQGTPESVASLTGGRVQAGQQMKPGSVLGFPSAQWYNSLLPSEQAQLAGGLSWLGINPDDWFSMYQKTIPGLSQRQPRTNWEVPNQ